MAHTTRPKTFGGARVLIAGGGVAALEAMFCLRALLREKVDIELLTPEPIFFYRPLSVVRGVRGVWRFELADLAEVAGAQLTLDALASVDAERHRGRTRHGAEIPYDFLVVACGALPRPVIRDALTFRGPADREAFAALVEAAGRSNNDAAAFCIPRGVSWTLPIYELAFSLRQEARSARITIRTFERRPLEILGSRASDTLSEHLRRASIELSLEDDPIRHPISGKETVVVAAPVLEGQRVLGIPADDEGFIPTSRYGKIDGIDAGYAAGDVTDFPVSQGSLAADQADAAAEAIAAEIGIVLEPQLFRPVIRAAIVAGDRTIFARRDLDDPADEGTISDQPLWSPPAKIAARHLAPALAELAAHPPR